MGLGPRFFWMALCLAGSVCGGAAAHEAAGHAREAKRVPHHARPLAKPTLIGRWGDWRAATHKAAGSVVCYAYTRLASSSTRLPGRGDVVLTVTERPGSPRDAVALTAGFVYPPGSQVDVTAGKVRMAFYTAERSAFARSGVQAVRAFDGAALASARSPAPRGRSVTDTFSMNGFADAHEAIVKACPLHA